jgi:hypothetical protein
VEDKGADDTDIHREKQAACKPYRHKRERLAFELQLVSPGKPMELRY